MTVLYSIMLIPWKFHGAPCYLTTHLWRKYRWESNIPSCPAISSHIHSQEPTQQFPHLATTLVSRTIATPLVSRTAAATHQLDNKLRHEIRHIPPFRWLLGIFYSLVSSRGNTRAKLTSVVCESLEASRVVGPIIITIFNYWVDWSGLPNATCLAGTIRVFQRTVCFQFKWQKSMTSSIAVSITLWSIDARMVNSFGREAPILVCNGEDDPDDDYY